jgi:hypothetical protein
MFEAKGDKEIISMRIFIPILKYYKPEWRRLNVWMAGG